MVFLGFAVFFLGWLWFHSVIWGLLRGSAVRMTPCRGFDSRSWWSYRVSYSRRILPRAFRVRVCSDRYITVDPSASRGLSNEMNHCWVFIIWCVVLFSAAGACQLAARKAPGTWGVRGGLPLLRRRHGPRAGRQAGAVWTRLSRNQQGECEKKLEQAASYNQNIHRKMDRLYISCLCLCRRWTLWSVRFSCWRICVTRESFSTTVVSGTWNRRSSPFLWSSCPGCV